MRLLLGSVVLALMIACGGSGGIDTSTGTDTSGPPDVPVTDLGTDQGTTDTSTPQDVPVTDLGTDTGQSDTDIPSDIPVVDHGPDDLGCTPDCKDKTCGDNGCGGSCGTCGNNEECKEGNCECTVGSEACQDVCCDIGAICFEDKCCTPDCDGKDCGDDGCGGSCGTCTGGKSCVQGQCEDVTPTWTDTSTGLVWQNPPFDGWKTWEEAKTYCTNNEAGLPGTGWHLPNISELRSLIRGCPDQETGGACGVTDECSKCGVGQSCLSWNPCYDDCTGCSLENGPANGCYWPNEMEGQGLCSFSWVSSSPMEGNATGVWAVAFSRGNVGGLGVGTVAPVRCVR